MYKTFLHGLFRFVLDIPRIDIPALIYTLLFKRSTRFGLFKNGAAIRSIKRRNRSIEFDGIREINVGPKLHLEDS